MDSPVRLGPGIGQGILDIYCQVRLQAQLAQPHCAYAAKQACATSLVHRLSFRRYYDQPKISGIFPMGVDAQRGDEVTITGSGFVDHGGLYCRFSPHL